MKTRANGKFSRFALARCLRNLESLGPKCFNPVACYPCKSSVLTIQNLYWSLKLPWGECPIDSRLFFLDGLLLSLWCFSILVNHYLQVSFNFKVILYESKIIQNTVTELFLKARSVTERVFKYHHLCKYLIAGSHSDDYWKLFAVYLCKGGILSL